MSELSRLFPRNDDNQQMLVCTKRLDDSVVNDSDVEEYVIYPRGYSEPRHRPRGYSYDREKGWDRDRKYKRRRRRSAEEGKGFLLAVLGFLVGLVLCSD
ncbi:hypothetical protein MMYC01_208963 [Madurella mycetomatis]|uniref:Uncharacterized protein n=1 Tax=Madurella mycetomatis TaxID=100816 RepID=A0A175VRL7_9PEZI|nr:hypothetical protein MMYC01_208963 [Madurella mycetomatis]